MAVVMFDTDVYSYLAASDQRRVMPYKPHLAGKTITLSFITAGEQYGGYAKAIARGKWPATRLAKLESEFRLVVVVPYDSEVCKTYGEIKAATDLAGRSVAASDLWIAACAIRHSLSLVTNNRKHFKDIPGLEIIPEAAD